MRYSQELVLVRHGAVQEAKGGHESMEMKTITVLGANGSMGAGCAGLFAAFGDATVYLVARNIDKAREGIEKAVASVRSDVIRCRLKPATYDDLPTVVPESDWVFESVAEDYRAKEEVFSLLRKHLKPGALISTGTSGLSIARLAGLLNERDRPFFLGTHFYNPPYKMLLCELVAHRDTAPDVVALFDRYLTGTLLRQVVHTTDSPAFAGNRVGFQLLNEIAQRARDHASSGGIAFMDAILGCHTGRAMPPLVTVDMVGLDVHTAIVDNLYANLDGHERSTFVVPDYFRHLTNLNKLGKKTGEGLYKTLRSRDGTKERLVYDITSKTYVPIPSLTLPLTAEIRRRIAESDYRGAVKLMVSSGDEEAKILRFFLARYLSYSFSIVGSVVPDRASIDKVMGFGFSWVPPSALVVLLGGVKAARDLIEQENLPVPAALQTNTAGERFYTLGDSLDARSLFRAR